MRIDGLHLNIVQLAGTITNSFFTIHLVKQNTNCGSVCISSWPSDFIWDFGKLPFPTHLGKYFLESGKISVKIHEIGKIKAIFGLGMTPI